MSDSKTNNISGSTWTDSTSDSVFISGTIITDDSITLTPNVIIDGKKEEVEKLDIKTFKEFKNLTADEKAMFIMENPNHSTKLLVLWLKQLEGQIKK